MSHQKVNYYDYKDIEKIEEIELINEMANMITLEIDQEINKSFETKTIMHNWQKEGF